LGGRKGIHPVKNLSGGDAGVVMCLGQGAGLHMAQQMPLPLTVSCTHSVKATCATYFEMFSSNNRCEENLENWLTPVHLEMAVIMQIVS